MHAERFERKLRRQPGCLGRRSRPAVAGRQYNAPFGDGAREVGPPDLKKAGLKAALFADVRPNPVEENVLAGCKAFKDGKHDGVVALGGGSGLDTGKMIALITAICKAAITSSRVSARAS